MANQPEPDASAETPADPRISTIDDAATLCARADMLGCSVITFGVIMCLFGAGAVLAGCVQAGKTSGTGAVTMWCGWAALLTGFVVIVGGRVINPICRLIAGMALRDGARGAGQQAASAQPTKAR